LAASGCGGESDADKARDRVCTARSDISTQVDALRSTTIESANVDQIREHLGTIQDDMATIKAQVPALRSDLRSQAEAANSRFEQALGDAQAAVRQSGSLESARGQVTAALHRLVADYSTAFDQLDC
jgi:hypothetical protein